MFPRVGEKLAGKRNHGWVDLKWAVGTSYVVVDLDGTAMNVENHSGLALCPQPKQNIHAMMKHEEDDDEGRAANVVFLPRGFPDRTERKIVPSRLIPALDRSGLM